MKIISLKNINIFLLLAFLNFSLIAQRPGGGPRGNAGPPAGIITGKVIDAKTEKGMVYTTVSLINLKDSSLVTGTVTDGIGEFKLTEVPFGKYFVKLSFIGYQTRFINDVNISPKDKNVDVGDLKLTADEDLLDEFEISTDKPAVTYEIDKKVVNVEGMNTVASASAVEVLENIPSITVDMDGNVALRGSSGFTLLIDGVPSAMDASEALQMIPASNIKDVEIITNPSAKYDAEGNAGIINVILKKDKLEGISTIVNAGAGLYHNYNADFLTSINKNKLKINIGGNFRNSNRYRTITQERRTSVGDQLSEVFGDGEHRFFGTNFGGNFAVEYAPNRKNVFSAGVNANRRQWNAAANYFFDELLNDTLVVAYENRERTLRDFFAFTGSTSYQHYFKGDKKHVLAFTTMTNLYDGKEDALTESYDGSENILVGNQAFEIGPSLLVRLNLDYERPFKNGMKLQTGLRTDFGDNSDDQDSYQYNITSETYERLPLFSSDVDYKQNVYAAYGILGGKLKEKLGYQFGIRSEYTDRFIKIATGNISTTIQRLDWFPSAHFSYQLDKKNQFKANFSRRIQRPRSWHLEPFITWEDPYTVRQGNPNLLPEYIQSYEVGYIRNLKKGSFSTELYYRYTDNVRERIQEVYDTNVILKRPINAGYSQSLGAEIAFNKRLKKWWAIDLGTNLFYYKIKGTTNIVNIDQETFVYNARLANSFNLPNDFKVQFVTKYNSPNVTAQGRTNGFVGFDIALKKDFMEKRLSVNVQFRNAFNTERRENWVETAQLYTYRLAVPRYPMLTVGASLKLNNYSSKDLIKTEEGDQF